MTHRWVVGGILALGLPAAVEARTIEVPGEAPSIAAALAEAEEGDEIVVGPGEYPEQVDFQGKNVVLRSRDGPAATTISGASSLVDASRGSVVLFDGGESPSAVLEGFTITGGTGTVVEAEDDVEAVAGGGILVANGSSPTIRGNVLRDNRLVSSLAEATTGGGVAVLGGCSPLLEGNEVFENSAQAGGGVAIVASSNPILRDNDVFQNAADYGGGIFVAEESAPRIETSRIRANQAQWGGGVYVQTWTTSPGAVDPWPPTVIVASEIAGNGAKTAGAGLCIFRASVVVERCTIWRNDVEFSMSGGWGGGLYVDGSRVRIASSLVARNSGYYGGGLYAQGDSSEVRVEHATIFKNSGSVGGGVALSHSSTPDAEIHNTILWENEGGLVGESPNLYNGDPHHVHCCDFSDGLYLHLNGNFSADPLFRDSGAGDLHLTEGSPCIDAGAELPTTHDDLDIDGDPRAVPGDGSGPPACDVGADEYVPATLVRFVRSDANVDGKSDISDAVTILAYLFLGTQPELECVDAADSDDSGVIDITDPIRILNYLFLGGPPPEGPFPGCGLDTTPDELDCLAFPPCVIERAA